jgi:hypothetical protein
MIWHDVLLLSSGWGVQSYRVDDEAACCRQISARSKERVTLGAGE